METKDVGKLREHPAVLHIHCTVVNTVHVHRSRIVVN